ncbi:MAG: MBL fold metallo-hydrolase [Gammaproteobacteria bacterium]
MSALDYSGPAPTWGERVALEDGVEWTRLPLPFKPGHINVYFLHGDDEAPFLLDTGYGNEETSALWDATPSPRRVVVTHFHPDHIGQAAHLEAAGAELYITRAEYAQARALHALSGEQLGESMGRFYAAHGVPYNTQMFGSGNGYRRSVPALPDTPHWLDTETLPFAPQWQVSVASGHSPAHALLFRRDNPVLAAGDIVLPEITPNISVWPDAPEADPLGDYLAALEALRALPADTLVLPAHGLPFRGLHERLDQLTDHHAKQLERLRDALDGKSATASSLMPQLFGRELQPGSIPFALGETLAHLHRLWRTGEIVREESVGCMYWKRASSGI